MPKATKSESAVTRIGVFGTHAPRCWAAGLTVVPVTPGTRACAVAYAGRINNLPDDKQRASLVARYADHDVGLLLGQSCDAESRSAALDVDDDRLVRFVRAVVGPAPAKFGSKGETLFVRMAADQRGTNIRNQTLNDKAAVLEVLCTGGHTVLPPSTHWKTGNPYRWTSEQTLPETPLDQWPLCEEWKLELLRKVVSWKRLPEVLAGVGTNIPMRDLVWCSLAWFGPDPAAPDGELAKQALAALLPDDYQGDTDEQLDRLVDKALAKGDYPRPDDSKTNVAGNAAARGGGRQRRRAVPRRRRRRVRGGAVRARRTGDLRQRVAGGARLADPAGAEHRRVGHQPQDAGRGQRHAARPRARGRPVPGVRAGGGERAVAAGHRPREARRRAGDSSDGGRVPGDGRPRRAIRAAGRTATAAGTNSRE
jgi:hypothetical protein